MNLEDFPMDKQRCPITLKAVSYVCRIYYMNTN